MGERLIRKAEIDDVFDIMRVHVEAWRCAYSGLVPDDFLTAMLAHLASEKRSAFWRQQIDHAASHFFVADMDGSEVIGWVQGGKSRDKEARTESEIYALYVLPGHWRQGVGQALMTRIHKEFSESAEITLWVLAGNQPAIDFYTRLGYRPDGATKETKTGNGTLTEVQMRRAPSQTAYHHVNPKDE